MDSMSILQALTEARRLADADAARSFSESFTVSSSEA